jgi:hypothetical protein
MAATQHECPGWIEPADHIDERRVVHHAAQTERRCSGASYAALVLLAGSVATSATRDYIHISYTRAGVSGCCELWRFGVWSKTPLVIVSGSGSELAG